MNEALTTEDPEKIKEALERLKNSQMEIGKAIYSQSSSDSAADEQAGQSEEPPKEEEEKKEEEKKEEKKE